MLLELTKTLVEVSKSLYEAAAKLGEQQQQARDRIADLFEGIATCLEKIASSAGEAEMAASLAELEGYIDNSARFEHVFEVVGTERLDLLKGLVKAVESAHAQPSALRKERKSKRLLAKAIGDFRATSKLLKVPGPIVPTRRGGQSERPRSLWKRLLAAAIVPLAVVLLLAWKVWPDPNPPCAWIAGNWVRYKGHAGELRLKLVQTDCSVTGTVSTDTGTGSHYIELHLSEPTGKKPAGVLATWHGNVKRIHNDEKGQPCPMYMPTTYWLLSKNLLREQAQASGCGLADYFEDYIYDRDGD